MQLSLVGASENCLAGSGFAGVEAFSTDTTFRLVKRDNTQCCFCLLFDSQFCCTVLSPLHSYKATFLCNDLLKLIVTVGVVSVFVPEVQCSLEQRLLHFI